MPLYPAVCAALQKTVDKHGHERKQKEADKPEHNGKEEDKEVVITTHILLGLGVIAKISLPAVFHTDSEYTPHR